MLPIDRLNVKNRPNETSSMNTNSMVDLFSEHSFKPHEISHLRWLSRPNLRLMTERHSSNLANLERFRITLGVTELRLESIKVSIENGVLTISGVREEEKQFEKRYELPARLDFESVTSFIDTQQKQLIIEILFFQNQEQMSEVSNDTQRRRHSFAINKFDFQNQRRLSTTSTGRRLSTQGLFGSSSNDVIIGIPPDLLQSGKTLMIVKYSELCIGGHHISQPANPIRVAQPLCLIDKQRQDNKSLNATHQHQNTIDDNEVFQVKMVVSPDIFQNEKAIIIQKSLTNVESNEKQLLANWIDLYKNSLFPGKNNILIGIPEQLISRGQTIVIQKNNVSIKTTDQYNKEQQHHHLSNNQFTKADNLKSKNMMEIIFQLPPEFLLSAHTITISREDLLINSYFSQQQEEENSTSGQTSSIRGLMANKMWNPSLSDDGDLLKMRLDLSNRSEIIQGNQPKVKLNGYDLRVEINFKQDWTIYRQITLPQTAQLNELKCHFEKQSHCLNISVPLH